MVRRQNAAIGIVTSGLPPPSLVVPCRTPPTTTYYGGITMPRPLLGCTFISNLHQLLRSSFLHPSFLVRHASHSHDYYHDYLRLSLQSSNPMLKSNEISSSTRRKGKKRSKKRNATRIVAPPSPPPREIYPNRARISQFERR